MKLFPAKKSSGFTLIELLIVIALLGALAVGLLATIDPFEQLKKGRDTSIRNTVSELYNATLRYYSTKGEFPWPVTDTVPFLPTQVSAMSTEIQLLESTGELKEGFINLAGQTNMEKVWISSPEPEDVRVCFIPESLGFKNEANTVYDQDGELMAPGANDPKCIAEDGGTIDDCYYCIK